MTIKSLILISFILTIALTFALISLITVVILNRKIIRAKKEISNFNDKFETYFCQNISHEFEDPISIIIELIDRIKNTVKTHVDSGCLVDIEMLSLKSENLKLLIEGVNSLCNIKDSSDNIVFGNVISYYQYLFESFSELAEIKKVDYLLHCNFRVLNINYNPHYLRTIFCNPVAKLLKDCSEGDKVKIEITLNKNLRYYKLEFINSSIHDYQSFQIETDLMLLVTKRIVNRLNGLFEIKHSKKGEIIYSMKLPLSNELNNQPMGCLTIHKPIKTGIKNENIQEAESNNNIRTNICPDFLNRVTSIIYRELTNTDNIIEIISSELCISQSQLNRRVKLMTGMTTSNFIYKTRLNKAG